MSKQRVELGPCPPDEEPAQVGQPDYEERSRAECRAYKNQLRRVFLGAKCLLRTVCSQHDFGTYREVVAEFDDSLDDPFAGSAMQDALGMETSGPFGWDELALQELSENGYPPTRLVRQWEEALQALASAAVECRSLGMLFPQVVEQVRVAWESKL